jgi:hypothetical protein
VKIGANRSSTTIASFRSGRACFKSAMAGVVRTQSPNERRRMIATRAPGGGQTAVLSALLLDFGFID